MRCFVYEARGQPRRQDVLAGAKDCSNVAQKIDFGEKSYVGVELSPTAAGMRAKNVARHGISNG